MLSLMIILISSTIILFSFVALGVVLQLESKGIDHIPDPDKNQKIPIKHAKALCIQVFLFGVLGYAIALLLRII